MTRIIQVIALAAAVVSFAAPAIAEPAMGAGGANRFSSYMRIYGPVQPPYGFVRFCNERPADCTRGTFKTARFQATPERLSELDAVNREINALIHPRTDLEIYGVTEYWTLPTMVGDCEDYALLKRKVLMDRGWPASSLLLTVVRDEIGEGHAVLTARTAQGDFILDNKLEAVRMWTRTPYEFVMRQSYLDPLQWVSLDARGGNTTNISLSGVQD